MKRIGVKIDPSLKEILSELITEVKLYNINDDEIELFDLDVVILDLKYGIDKDIKYFNNKNVPIILLCSRITSFKEIKEYFKRKEIYDCIYRDEYFEIEKCLDEISLKKNEIKKIEIKMLKEIVINNNFYKAIIKIEDIMYLEYCRLSRKTEITTTDGKIYASKKGFSEVEEKLKELNCFIKVDRGTIINKSLIKELDYKGEKIIFLNDRKLSVSRSKLKNLEENIDLFRNKIEL